MQTPTPTVGRTVPRSWEVDRGFHEHLYEWMERAPWLAISAAFHLFLFFVLTTIPWEVFRPAEPPVLEVAAAPPEEELFEHVEEPPPEVVTDDTVVDEPTLRTDDALDEPSPDETEEPAAALDFTVPSDTIDVLPLLGLGGGGAKLGGRGLGSASRGRGRGTAVAVRRGLSWLAAHQSPDGSWDGDGFTAHCGEIGTEPCDGAGSPRHDVGLTALALLAFLGDGHTTVGGSHREVVGRGFAWLTRRADPDTGVVGQAVTKEHLYDHALAALAFAELFALTRSPLVRPAAQRAIDACQAARNPYSAWRYELRPNGENDTSVTGWMVFALAAARDAGLRVDPAALDGALSWLDEVTDPETGRVGYEAKGSLSSRTRANEHYPREKGEAMTAVGLLCRIFLGQSPAEVPVMDRHAELLLRCLPAWDPEGFGCDMYYWYYGTYAMYQLGGARWRAWEKAMEPSMIRTQRREGDVRGSWDPVGPWGHVGGRVYSTALMTLSMEVYYRYARLTGTR